MLFSILDSSRPALGLAILAAFVILMGVVLGVAAFASFGSIGPSVAVAIGTSFMMGVLSLLPTR